MLFALSTGHWHEKSALEYIHWSHPNLAKFEECLERLEKIVQELEKGEVPLEKSLTLFEEGMQLSASCRKQLEEAEGKVEILLKQNGKLQAEPFEPPAGKALRK
jgi:exodeoxyribonuclease VII small subunit